MSRPLRPLSRLALGGMLAVLGGSLLPAQTADNPTYSSSVYSHGSAAAYLQEMESHANDPRRPSNRYLWLPFAAKAALEAGENTKAEAYAVEGLKLADQHAAKHKNHRAYTGVGTADFTCNLVLGRIAVLRSQIETAEHYLLAASMTTGDASLDSYGANMSLANEILKSGDPNRWTVVYTFLQNCRVFWKIEPRVIDAWSEDVRNHRIPAFQEQLYRY